MPSLPTQAFLSALAARPPNLDEEAVDRALSAALSSAHTAHEALALDAEAFARYLAEKVGRTEDVLRALAELRPGDLALTFACAKGDRVAMELLDHEVIRTAARVTSRIDAAPAFIDEVRQRLRERLLMSEGNAGPRIREFSGKGSLQAWANVTAMRIALNLKAVPAREVPMDPEALDPWGGDTTMESRVARGRHGPELVAAFTEAAAALSSEERLLLRYHFADGLNFEQIAPLFHTHRSTISRKIAAARKKLLEGTRKALGRRLGADATEISSLLKMHTRLDVEITAVLREKE